MLLRPYSLPVPSQQITMFFIQFSWISKTVGLRYANPTYGLPVVHLV